MADERRVSTALVAAVLAGTERRVSTAAFYTVHGPNERRLSTAALYVIVPEDANDPPSPPTVTTSAISANSVTLTGSAYHDPDGDVHAASQFRVRRRSDAAVLADTGEIAATVGPQVLAGLPEATECWGEIRYRDDQGAWSEWGQAAFTTLDGRPTKAEIISPTDGEVVYVALALAHTASIDPEGKGVTYTAEVRAIGDSIWTELFAGREETSLLRIALDSLGPAGEYEIRLWATSESGRQSEVDTRRFTTRMGADPTFTFIEPLSGSRQLEAVRLRWAPVDGALRYVLRYRKAGDSNWTLISDVLAPWAVEYIWYIADEGEHHIEGWAVLADGNSPSDTVVVFLDRQLPPERPTISITDISTTSVVLAGTPYRHPLDVPHKRTEFEVIYAFLLTVQDPVKSVSLPAPVIHWTATDLPMASLFGARVRYQDESDRWSEWSEYVFFTTEDTSGMSWKPVWEMVTSHWGPHRPLPSSVDTGLLVGESSRYGCLYSPHLHWTGCPHNGRAGVVRTDRGTYGSARVSGYGMINEAGGDWWAYRFNTSNGSQIGVVLADGVDMPGATTSVGVFAWLDVGVVHTLNGSSFDPPKPDMVAGQSGKSTIGIAIRDKYANSGSPYHRHWVGDVGKMFVQHAARRQPDWRGPPHPNYETGETTPWYLIELKVQRHLSSPTGPKTVVYARGFGAGLLPSTVLEDEGDPDNHDHFWHMRVEVPFLVECGYPGFAYYQRGGVLGGSNSALRGGLTVQAIPDLGVPPAPPSLPPGPGAWEPEGPYGAPEPEAEVENAALFPAPPDWGEGVEEVIVYHTDVIPGQDDTEQRLGLRARPRRELRYTALCMDLTETARMEALLWERQAHRWAVPLWMDALPLAADLPAGATVIPAGLLEGRRFGRRAVLWRNLFQHVLVEGERDEEGNLMLSSPLAESWATGSTLLAPVELGWMQAEQGVERPATTVLQIPVTFTLEEDG